MATENPVLIAFDGSEDAERAIEHAGTILNGETAVVLTVWEPLVVAMSRTLRPGLLPNDTAELDERSKQQAASVARAGAELARRAGLKAEPRSVEDANDIAETVSHVAEELDAPLIVTGARGLKGFQAHLLGSVSTALVRNAHRPVLVVPPPDRPTKNATADRTPVGHSSAG